MSAQVTEAHRELAYAILFATEDGHAGPNETAQLIADSEAKATAELKKRADHWCDMHTVCAKKANQLRAELATCKDASEALVESLRAEVEWLRECYDQTSALCGKFITEDDGTDLIPNSARIANALTRLEARAERAEAELAGIRALADRRNKRYHVEDTTHQLVAALDQALDIAQAELAACKESLHLANGTANLALVHRDAAEAELTAERARLRQIALDACRAAAIVPLVWYPAGHYINPNDLGKINKQQVDACVAAIDAAMKEGA